MRLIDTETGQFKDFVEGKIPPYAILSHTWDKDGEQTYQDVLKIQEKYRDQPPPPKNSPLDSRSHAPGSIPKARPTSEVLACSECGAVQSMSSENPQGLEAEASPEIQSAHTSPTTHRSIWDANSGLSEKVRSACEIARRDGYRYIWIDSCCINKESSSELSEAINSMFKWYRAGQICYSFLVDVSCDKDPRAKNSEFRNSRWFKRGWTLQELVAPYFVVFLSKHWEGLGTKEKLADVIQEITSIHTEILTHKRALSDESVANRMRWASKRKTTRVEDEAYSLLGIFEITMSTLYGEGEYAFRRLQEEILRRIPDQSIFAWGDQKNIPAFPMTSCTEEGYLQDTVTLLALSPSKFINESNQIIPATEESLKSLPLPVEEYTHTPYGIRTQLCMLPLQQLNPDFTIIKQTEGPEVPWYLAILRAQKATAPHGVLGQLCYLRKSDKTNIEFLYRGLVLFSNHLYELSLDVISGVGELETHWKTVYLPHPKPSELVSRPQLWDLLGDHAGVHRLSLTIPTWIQDALSVHGFRLSDVPDVQGANEHHPNSFSFTLHHAAFKIHILYQHATNPPWLNEYDVVIKAWLWILPLSNEPFRTNVIQLSPPSDSATWVQTASDMIFPSKRLVLRTTGDGDNLVTSVLSLGLDLTAPYRYNIHFDAAPQIYEVGASTCTHSQDIRPDSGLELELPYKTLDFILPGSVRRSLETKRYSVHFSLEPSLGDTHSHTLTLSTDSNAGKFSIVVKYLQVHMRIYDVLSRSALNMDSKSQSELEPGSKRHLEEEEEEIYIVARITVESDDAFETVHDGPHVVEWHDRHRWNHSLEQKNVVLTTPIGDPLTLQLGFDLAWLYQYYLHVDVTPSPSHLLSTPTRITSPIDEPRHLLGWAHRGISLTLHTNVNRALQAQGFQVRFKRSEGEGASGDPIHDLLTLSHTRAGFHIVIKYLHDLKTRYPDQHSDHNDPDVMDEYTLSSGLSAPTAKASVERCDQNLIFEAFISTSLGLPIGDTPSRVTVRGDTTTTEVKWNASGYRGWERRLHRKDLTLTLPMGHQLMVRLGFDLVWYSEYCPTVEINPRTPLPRSYSWDPDPIPVPDYELGDDGMEYIRQSSTQSAEPGVGQSAEAPNDDPEPLPTDLSTFEESPVENREPEDARNLDAKEQPREGVAVEAQGEAMQLVVHSRTQSQADHDTSDAVHQPGKATQSDIDNRREGGGLGQSRILTDGMDGKIGLSTVES